MLWITQSKRATVLAGFVVAVCGAGAYVGFSFAANASDAPATSTPAPVLGPTAKTKGLHFATGPANAQQLIADRLKRLADRGTGGDPATIKVGPMLQVWKLNGTDIIGGRGLASADLYLNNSVHEKEWQCLLLTNGEGVGVVNLDQFDGRQATVGALLNGDPDGIGPALAKLAEMKEVKEGSYEVRHLNIAGVVWDNPQVYGLWLKSEDGGKDYIYPVYPVAISDRKDLPGWEPKLYTQEEFLKVVKPMAEEAKRILTTRPFSFNGAPQP